MMNGTQILWMLLSFFGGFALGVCFIILIRRSAGMNW